MKENEKVLEKIKKLLALAGNNPSEEEAKAAMLKAQELMLRYHIENPETINNDKVVAVYYDLGSRRKTEFVLLISVLVADNFRSRTVHSGQKIYFIGFEADAKAAMEVYVYLLNFGDQAHDRYFSVNPISRQADIDWRYGYIAGLQTAFNSRAGYELMITVPTKVQELVDKLNKKNTEFTQNDRPSRLQGAFTDGFRRGRESMDKREIEAH